MRYVRKTIEVSFHALYFSVYYQAISLFHSKYEITKQQRIELKIKNMKAIGFSEIEIRIILLKEDTKIEKITAFIH